MTKHIHMVAHDVPYPTDYGGVIDIFYTLQCLHRQGIEITLHCFEYGRGHQDELLKYCRNVYYYSRKEGHKGFCFHLPYIVASRSNPELVDRLAADQDPILLEGLHCSYLLRDERFSNRKIVMRAFNAESRYYKQLFHHEKSLFKKAYFLNESRLLHRYETEVASRLEIITLSDDDTRYYRENLGATRVQTVPVLIPYQEVKSAQGMGSFCLYHGNLGVAENEKAASWLMKEVVGKLKIPFIIAGKNPSTRLDRQVQMSCHTCLIADPCERELDDLINKAQINILPSFNETGIKLKLLNALFNGRHCIVNQASVSGTALAPLCHIAEQPTAIQRLIQQLYYQPFEDTEIRLRETILYPVFNNETNARKISSCLL